jgi:hypothetical protein
MLNYTAWEWGTEPVAALLEGLDLDRLRAGMSAEQRASFDNAIKPFESLRRKRAGA